MIREFQVRQQLGFMNGVHFLNRLFSMMMHSATSMSMR